MKLTNSDLQKEYINNIIDIELATFQNSPFRFWYRHLLKYHNQIKGDIIELGVFNGRSLLTMVQLFCRLYPHESIRSRWCLRRYFYYVLL